MIKSRIAVAAALFAVAGAANAEFSLTPAITTDYDFRGLTQNEESEEFQLGLNISAESGLYFSAWASQVEFGGGNDAIWELDTTVGFTGGDANETFGYDVGAIGYFYPSSDDTYDVYEIFAGVSKGWFSGKLWFSPSNRNWAGGLKKKSSLYTEGNVTIPVPHDFTVVAHAGYSSGKAFKVTGTNLSYLDYSLGVNKSLGNFDLNLKYVNSNDYEPYAVGRNAWIGTISTTLPWGRE